MFNAMHGFCFDVVLLFIIINLNCSLPLENDHNELDFRVIDVGQGLSQLAVSGSDAVLWDIGTEESYDLWLTAYKRAGCPLLKAIIISHSDLDHCGGLCRIDSVVNWNGVLITSPFEDTSYLKSMLSRWEKNVQFRSTYQNDSLQIMSGISVNCLWPPKEITVSFPIQSEMKNRLSLCFLIKNLHTSIMISSDIDSVVENQLAQKYCEQLKADILIVPHHGSMGSFNPVFSGYVYPQMAIISCARQNPFGHPSETVVLFFIQMGADIKTTYSDQTVFLRSNGFYWELQSI
jgi:competence protein ComEC